MECKGVGGLLLLLCLGRAAAWEPPAQAVGQRQEQRREEAQGSTRFPLLRGDAFQLASKSKWCRQSWEGEPCDGLGPCICPQPWPRLFLEVDPKSRQQSPPMRDEAAEDRRGDGGHRCQVDRMASANETEFHCRKVQVLRGDESTQGREAGNAGGAGASPGRPAGCLHTPSWRRHLGEDMEIEEIPDEAQKEWDELLVDAERNEDVVSRINGALLGRELLEILTAHRARKAAAVETGDAITPCLTPSASPASPAAMTADQTKKGPTVTTFRTRLTSHRVSHLPAPDLLGHPRRSQSTDKPSGMARPSWFARARSSIFTLTVPGILHVFALSIFLAYQGTWALFGACGDCTHGHEHASSWVPEGPPLHWSTSRLLSPLLLCGLHRP